MKTALAFLTSRTGRLFWSVHLPVLVLVLGISLRLRGAISVLVLELIAGACLAAFIFGLVYFMRTMGRHD